MSFIFDRVTSFFVKESCEVVDAEPVIEKMAEMSRLSSAPPLLLLPALTDEQKFTHLMRELEDAVQSLAAAEKDNATAQEKLGDFKKELEDRSWWEVFKGAFNGTTDQELTKNIEFLGRSVEVTQKVVRVLLQVQTQKGRLLQAFNDALVEKIVRIQGDTQTLDGNQNTAALAFLGELHQQIQEQIRQQELIEQHEQNLQELRQWQGQQDLHATGVLRKLHGLHDNLREVRQGVAEHDRWRQEAYAQEVTRLEGQLQMLEGRNEALQARVSELESAADPARPLIAMLFGYGLPVLAVCLAVIALLRSAV